jgi:hypothetical protein
MAATKPEVLISSKENQTNTLTGIDQIALILLHYFVLLDTRYCHFYCSVFDISKLGRTLIASYGRMHGTAEPTADYAPSAHFFV